MPSKDSGRIGHDLQLNREQKKTIEHIDIILVKLHVFCL